MPGLLFVILLILCVPAVAQVPTRTAEIEAERDKKSQELAPDEVSKAEGVLRDIKDKKLIERFQSGVNGFRVKLGGLATGGGFALGPEYIREDLASGQLTLRGSSVFSFSGFRKYDLELFAPKTRTRPVFFQAYAVRHNYPDLQYYGQGPESEKTGRSVYRYEDVALDGSVGWVIGEKLRVVGSGGYLMVNTGPGTDKTYASIEQNFNTLNTPGLETQPNFARVGGYVEWDGTDYRLGPRKGTYLIGGYNRYGDQSDGTYTHDRLDIELQEYIPFFNLRRVIAVRGKTNLTFADAGYHVPFYLQPVLGGSDDLRGFRPYRFYGNNLMVWNAEYRWEVSGALDMAAFFDAGKVVDKKSQINFHNLETSVGFGLRWNVKNSVFLRLDVGFSHEGFAVWFKFNDIFAPKRIISSSSQTLQ